MAFDPSKYGAVPVESFDPSKYGATPVTSMASPPQAKQPLSERIWSGIAATGNALTKVLPGKQIGQSIGTLAGYVASPDKEFYDLSAPSPVQTVADVANAGLTVGSLGLGTAGSLAARTATGAALGAGLGGTRATAEGRSGGEIAQSAAIGGAIGGAIPLVGEGFRQFGKLLSKTGEKIQTTVIKPSSRDIADGFKIDTIKKYNLGGSLKTSFEKTDQTIDDLTKQLNAKLAEADSAVDLNKVYENTVKKSIGNKLEQFGSNTSMDNALEQLRKEVVAVSGNNGVVSIPQAQTVKRAAGHFGAWQYGFRDPEATAREKVYNLFYTEIKTAIEKNSPSGVREINRQISELIPVMNALIRRIPVAERSSALSLTDMISLSAATLEPRALALTLANLASKSGTVGAALSRTGERIAQPTRQPIQNILRTGITNLLGLRGRGQETRQQ